MLSKHVKCSYDVNQNLSYLFIHSGYETARNGV